MFGGLNDKDKRQRMRNLLRSWRVDVVCLQETKVKNMSQGMARIIRPNQFADWAFL